MAVPAAAAAAAAAAAPAPGRAPDGGAQPVCAVCGGATSTVLRVPEVPALCNEFFGSADAARAASRGAVHLTFCKRCDLLSNAAFDGGLVSYTGAYENSIHFSTAFDGYARDLAARLVDTYGLRHRTVVEIGCGSGDFLALMCRLGPNRGVGFDPSHDPARAPDAAAGDGFEVHRTVFDGRQRTAAGELIDPDFVVARHVLEHVPDPLGMAKDLRRSLGERDDVVVYIEVPDATFMLEAPAIWDVIHEHCSYFTEPSLRALLSRAGFTVVASGRSMGDQYLWVEATPATASAATPLPVPVAETGTAALAVDFERRFAAITSAWAARLRDLDPARTAIWGAGAKGVMFLNLVDPQGHLQTVIDVNPHKRGKFVPCTGQRIVSPDDLDEGNPPSHVVVMNPAFRDEIEAALRGRGLDSTVLTA